MSDPDRRRDAFRFSHRMADCGAFTVGVARHTMTLNGDWDPLDDILLFSHLLSGRFTIGSPRSQVDAGAGDVFAYDPDARKTVEWSDIRMAQIRLQRSMVERTAAELVGDDRPRGPIGFELARPLTEVKAQHWKRLMQYVTSEIAVNPAAHGSPLIMQQAFRLVLATALETFPNTTMRDDHRPGVASPAAVRLAVEFMQANAAADIDLTGIAEAAQVGPRARQRAFRRALDTTPLAYLRTVRLDRARDELRTADAADGTTVTGVAARWGVGHPGRFVADYRARFGTSPGETLRS